MNYGEKPPSMDAKKISDLVQKVNPSKNAEYIRSQVYQTRYNLKVANEKENSTFFNYMRKMLSQDQLVNIKKPNHLPIMLLHKKFFNPNSPGSQTQK